MRRLYLLAFTTLLCSLSGCQPQGTVAQPQSVSVQSKSAIDPEAVKLLTEADAALRRLPGLQATFEDQENGTSYSGTVFWRNPNQFQIDESSQSAGGYGSKQRIAGDGSQYSYTTYTGDQPNRTQSIGVNEATRFSSVLAPIVAKGNYWTSEIARMTNESQHPPDGGKASLKIRRLPSEQRQGRTFSVVEITFHRFTPAHPASLTGSSEASSDGRVERVYLGPDGLAHIREIEDTVNGNKISFRSEFRPLSSGASSP